MHDVLDIIKNVQSLYSVGPTLGILKDFERVVDELDVYVFANWKDGELLSGPNDSRHFVTCSFMILCFCSLFSVTTVISFHFFVSLNSNLRSLMKNI